MAMENKKGEKKEKKEKLWQYRKLCVAPPRTSMSNREWDGLNMGLRNVEECLPSLHEALGSILSVIPCGNIDLCYNPSA